MANHFTLKDSLNTLKKTDRNVKLHFDGDAIPVKNVLN